MNALVGDSKIRKSKPQDNAQDYINYVKSTKKLKIITTTYANDFRLDSV